MERRTGVFYQVCIDRPGEPPFDGTGVLHEHVSEALRDLKATRDIRPHAYLAIVTFERFPHPIEHDSRDQKVQFHGGSAHVH